MNNIRINVTQTHLKLISGGAATTSKSVLNDTCTFIFEDEYWSGLTDIVGAFGSDLNALTGVHLTQNSCTIPQSALGEEGTLYIGLIGTNGSRTVRSELLKIKIKRGAVSTAEAAADVPSNYEQLLGIITTGINNIGITAQRNVSDTGVDITVTDPNGNSSTATVNDRPTDYTQLTNKPSINGVTLSGNKTTEDLNINIGVTGLFRLMEGDEVTGFSVLYSDGSFGETIMFPQTPGPPGRPGREIHSMYFNGNDLMVSYTGGSAPQNLGPLRLGATNNAASFIDDYNEVKDNASVFSGANILTPGEADPTGISSGTGTQADPFIFDGSALTYIITPGCYWTHVDDYNFENVMLTDGLTVLSVGTQGIFSLPLQDYGAFGYYLYKYDDSTGSFYFDLVDLSGYLTDFINVTEQSIEQLWQEKQATFTAGSNITIIGHTISATDTTYNAGTDITITNNAIAVDKSTVVQSGDTKPVTSDAVYNAIQTAISGAVSNVLGGSY